MTNVYTNKNNKILIKSEFIYKLKVRVRVYGCVIC